MAAHLILALSLSFVFPLSAQGAAPTETPNVSSALGGNSYLEVAFTGTSPGATSMKYQLSTDGINYSAPEPLDTPDTRSPITIFGVSNGTSYFVKLLFSNSSGDGPIGSANSTAADVGPKTFLASNLSNAYLMGIYAEVGVRANGAFGTNAAPPDGFHENLGETCLGFRVDREKDGWDASDDRLSVDDGDFFCPGSEYEGFFLKVDGRVFTNKHDGTQLPGSLGNISSTDGIQSVEWNSTGAATSASANTAAGIQLRQVASVPDQGQVLHVDIALTNNSANDINDIYYGRGFDPDNQTAPQVFTSLNTVLSRENPASVQSTWSNGALIVLKSDDPRARAARRDSGLEGSDPQHIWDAPTNATTNGWTSTPTPDLEDAGTGVALNIGTLAAGASTTFRISYVLSDNEASLPTTPTLDTVTSGDGELSLAFTQAGNEPTNYDYSLDGGINWITRNPSSTASPLVIDDLTNGTTYQLKVRGRNAFGFGPASNLLTGTPSGLPGTPTINSATATSDSLIVDFAPGSSGGSEFVNYEYALSTDGVTFAAFQSVSPVATVSPIVISGLAVSTSYTVKVRSTTTNGISSDSNTVSATTARPPLAPVIETISVSSEVLEVNFSPGAAGGLPITNYEYSLDGGSTWTSRSPVSVVSPIRLTGLTDGTSYAVVIRAINELGTGDNSNQLTAIPIGPPGAPTLAGSAVASANKIDLTITAPANDGGGAITSYQYSTDRGVTWRTRTDSGGNGTNLSITVLSSDGTTQLDNGTEYCVQVQAVNSAGSGPASSDVCATPKTVPDAPTISSLTSRDGGLFVAFETGSNGGSAITDVEYSVDGGANWVSSGSTGESFLISSLTNGTSYTVELRIVNAEGNSPSDSESGVPSTTPGAPSVDLVIPSSEKLTIEFTPPANDNGSAVTNYEYSVDGGATWNSRSPAATTNPLVITGLTNNTTYQVQLRAVNQNGSGEATPSAIASTPRLIPEAPTIDSITAGNGTLSVAFTAGSDNGIPLTNYEFSVDNGVTWAVRAPASTNSPILIQGLTNGQQYQVRIRATNADFSGAQSGVINETPFTVPSAPTSLAATSPSSASINVSFTAASDGGRAISAYQYSLNGGSSWTTFNPSILGSPGSITGLAAGQTVFLKVRALNIAGNGIASATLTFTPSDPADETPPSLLTAVAPSSGELIVLTFNENLKSNSVPPTGSFTVQVDGNTVTLSSPIVLSGATVRISVSAPILPTSSVAVSYADPSTGNDNNVIEDSVGNDALSFSAVSVTNQSTFAFAWISNLEIVGNPWQGGQLTASASLLGSGTTVTYQWKIASESHTAFVNLSGETGQTIDVVSSYLGQWLKVEVSSTNFGGSVTVLSDAVGPIVPLVQAVAISGQIQVGPSLEPLLTGQQAGLSLTYSWQVSTTSAGVFEEYSTASSLALVSDLVGKFIQLSITAANGSNRITLLSSSVGPVVAPAGSSPIPNYTGPVITKISPNVVIEVKGQTITITGLRLGKAEKLMVGPRAVTILSASSTEIRFQLPQLTSGVYDITYFYDGAAKLSYINAIEIRDPSSSEIDPSRAGTATDTADSSLSPGAWDTQFRLIASDFAPGSFALTPEIRVKTRELVRNLATYADSVTCVGRTSGPTILEVDQLLAERRGRAICEFIKTLRPRLDTTFSGETTIRTGSLSRTGSIRFTRKG